MKVVGADGCRGGWVLADRDGAEVVERLDDIVADATVVVVGLARPVTRRSTALMRSKRWYVWRVSPLPSSDFDRWLAVA